MLPHLAVLNIVGLTPNMIGEHTPNLNRLIKKGMVAPMEAVFPAVTTTAQSAMLTGKQANDHGVVGNGWYFKELAEVGFWKQNNSIVESDKVWDTLKKRHAGSEFKVSKLFWWYNMYANVDASMTPRPHYLADGGKVFDLYSSPQGLHQGIEEKIGKFPFFTFWGPNAGIASSEWIAKAAIEEFKISRPNLQLVYLPHLDYNLQRLGPNHPDIKNDIQKIDTVFGLLLDFYEANRVEVVVVSEYGITEVDTPIHINRTLRENGFIAVRETVADKWPKGFELLDCGASKAFAVADHQCAHVYVNDLSLIDDVKKCLLSVDGIESVLDKNEQQALKINHSRSGDLVVISKSNAWFTYYYWLDDSKAPEFSRTVDIHRKPGYDPVELFVDPQIPFPKLKLVGKLLKKKLGQRVLMDFIPLDATLVKGSHGRVTDASSDGPIYIGPKVVGAYNVSEVDLKLTDVHDLILGFFEA